MQPSTARTKVSDSAGPGVSRLSRTCLIQICCSSSVAAPIASVACRTSSLGIGRSTASANAAAASPDDASIPRRARTTLQRRQPGRWADAQHLIGRNIPLLTVVAVEVAALEMAASHDPGGFPAAVLVEHPHPCPTLAAAAGAGAQLCGPRGQLSADDWPKDLARDPLSGPLDLGGIGALAQTPTHFLGNAGLHLPLGGIPLNAVLMGLMA